MLLRRRKQQRSTTLAATDGFQLCAKHDFGLVRLLRETCGARTRACGHCALAMANAEMQAPTKDSAHNAATSFPGVERASCGIRTHDLPLTERVLCQLS